MKQKYAVLVLLVLIAASGMTSFHSYRATERLVEDDMSQALTLALDEQQSDVINADTIKVFNSYLQLEELRGQALLAVDTKQKGFRCEARCSAATIFSMSEQRPALALWMLAMLWASVSSNEGKKCLCLQECCNMETYVILNQKAGSSMQKVNM